MYSSGHPGGQNGNPGLGEIRGQSFPAITVFFGFCRRLAVLEIEKCGDEGWFCSQPG